MMAQLTLTLRGRLLTAKSPTDIQELIRDLMLELSKSATVAVQDAFNRSVQLATYAGQSMDPEAVRAIIRGLKVEVSPTDPPRLIAKFQDDLSHLYGGEEDLPEELITMLESILDEGLHNWLKSRESQQAVAKVFNA